MFIPIPTGTIYLVLIALLPIHPALSIFGTSNRFHDHMQHNIARHQNITPFFTPKNMCNENGRVSTILTLSLEFDYDVKIHCELQRHKALKFLGPRINIAKLNVMIRNHKQQIKT